MGPHTAFLVEDLGALLAPLPPSLPVTSEQTLDPSPCHVGAN